MAYGNYCPVCKSMVDYIEFDFTKKMCKECVSEQEQEDIRRAKVAQLMNAKCEQMIMEV